MNNKITKDFIKSYTDNYFLKSKQIIKKYGDLDITYAVFIRRPGIVALKLAIDWIKAVAKERKIKIQKIILCLVYQILKIKIITIIIKVM